MVISHPSASLRLVSRRLFREDVAPHFEASNGCDGEAQRVRMSSAATAPPSKLIQVFNVNLDVLNVVSGRAPLSALCASDRVSLTTINSSRLVMLGRLTAILSGLSSIAAELLKRPMRIVRSATVFVELIVV